MVGAGGLFGSALVRQSGNSFSASPIEWDSNEAALEQLTENLKRFQVAALSQNWCIAWAAGHATTASTQSETKAEFELFNAFLLVLSKIRPAGQGVFFLTSSAGGVYAGSNDPPFTDSAIPVPLSAYGKLKLAQETSAVKNLGGVVPVVIGRVSNLYGPGQNLSKLQGLLSRLALSAITKESMSIFVSLDTLRDYIYSDDAARVALHFINLALKGAPDEHHVRVIASGQPVSVGHLIHLMQDISRTKIPISYGTHESASGQAQDLRLIPSSAHQVDAFLQTPLGAGAKAVYLDILSRYQRRNYN